MSISWVLFWYSGPFELQTFAKPFDRVIAQM